MTKLLQSFKPYFSPKILAVGFLSFASGLPILMTLSTLTHPSCVIGSKSRTSLF